MIMIITIVGAMPFNKHPLTAIAALSLLALVGCGASSSPAGPASQTPGHQDSASSAASEAGHAGHDHGAAADATETPEASPRIAVGTQTGIVLLDEHLHVLAEYPTPGRPTLTTAHDGRHIFGVQGAAGVVSVLDSGTWTQGHGDHFHSFVTDPQLLTEVIEGGRPVHVVPNAETGVTAIYFDEEGLARLVDEEALAHGELHGLSSIDSAGPHHGLVAPLGNGSWLVTQPVGTETGTPNTVDLVGADGTTSQTFDCQALHGEAVVGTTAAFGCADKVLIIRDGVATDVPTPTDGEARVGSIVADATGSNFMGNFGPTGLVFINGDVARQVDIGVSYGNLAVTSDDRFAVLGTDGALRLFDVRGELLQTIQVTSPWTKPTGHGGVAPVITTGTLQAANMVWVSEPDANQVHAVDLFSNTVSTVEVGDQPGSIAVANAN